MVRSIMGKVILGIFYTISLGYSFQPRKCQIFWGNLLGWFIGSLGFRHSTVEKNLSFAYPEDPSRRKKLLRDAYLNFGNLILEIFMVLPSLGGKAPMRRFVSKYVDFEGAHYPKQAWDQGKKVIFLSSHLGNWEVMAASGVLIAEADLLLVTKRIKPRWLHQVIEKGRKSYGVSGAYEPKTLQKILSHLKKDRAAVGFVLDQYVGPPAGVRVPFFGIPVGTSLIVAALAKRTGAVVLPVENFRKPDGRWQVTIAPALVWRSAENHHYELAVNTEVFQKEMEESIFKNPEQWLWTHRRFKGNLGPLKEGEWSQSRVRA